eukprot:3431210-Amphidinium_carterae.1
MVGQLARELVAKSHESAANLAKATPPRQQNQLIPSEDWRSDTKHRSYLRICDSSSMSRQRANW